MNHRRGSILAVLGCCALFSGCGVAVRQSAKGYRNLRYASAFTQGRRGPVTPAELDWAKTAWKYFQNNTTGGTGIANALDKTPLATAWSIGDYLAALIAARELNILPEQEFTDRTLRVVQFLNDMKLFEQKLPNLYYNTQTGEPVNAGNSLGSAGWSAMDIGRLLVWLRIAAQRLPALAEYIEKSVLRWSFCEIVDGDGSLYAARKTGDKIEVQQEGRLGYEEYAALGFQAWGFGTRQASRLQPFGKARIEGIEVFYDSRDSRQSNTFAPVVTLPHVLMGMEFNWERPDAAPAEERTLSGLAQQVYDVQEARYRKQHILTARSDHPLDRKPAFVYDTIFLAGYPWNTLAADGTLVAYEALVSTRAAFGMWALWKTDYTETLIQATSMLRDPARGWYEGRFERTGGPEMTLSSTTNATVLEAILFTKTGRLFRTPAKDDYYALALRSEFSGPQTCLPQRR